MTRTPARLHPSTGGTARCAGLRATRVGTAGRDVIRGTAKRGVIVALGGNDHAIGDAGNDRVLGEDGGDLLDGGAGGDRLEGGAGKDLLLVEAPGPSGSSARARRTSLAGGAERTCAAPRTARPAELALPGVGVLPEDARPAHSRQEARAGPS